MRYGLRAFFLAPFLASLAACVTTPAHDPNQTDARQRPSIDLGADAFSQHTIRAWEQYKKTYNTIRNVEITAQPEPQQLNEYITTGMVYVDQRCQDYFHALHSYYKQKKEGVRAANLLTAGVTAIMAALHSAAKEIAAVAVGGTSGAALMDNAGSSVLYELDPATTQSLVVKARDLYQRNIPTTGITTFQQALLIVQRYADLCMPATIERMVQEAVTAGTAKTTGSSSMEQVSLIATQRARDDLARVLGLSGGLSDSDVLYLYWLTELSGSLDENSRKIIRSRLSSDIRDKMFDSGAETLKSDAPLTSVSAALRQAALVDGGLRSGATRLREQELAAAAKPAPKGLPTKAPPAPPARPVATPFVVPHIFF